MQNRYSSIAERFANSNDSAPLCLLPLLFLESRPLERTEHHQDLPNQTAPPSLSTKISELICTKFLFGRRLTSKYPVQGSNEESIILYFSQFCGGNINTLPVVAPSTRKMLPNYRRILRAYSKTANSRAPYRNLLFLQY